jgi:hypothetical protein
VGPDPRLASKLSGAGVQLLDGRKLHGREVEEAAMWQCIETHSLYPNGTNFPKIRWSGSVLDEAYTLCGDITAEYAKTFYLGTQLMTPKQAKAIWAIYVWCRRTDELVDGPNASRITPKVIAGAALAGQSVDPAMLRPHARRHGRHGRSIARRSLAGRTARPVFRAAPA